MNTRNVRQWELRLGIVHLVSLVGLVCGSLALAFYLGFFSGQNSGYEKALAASISNVPKLPITGAAPPHEGADQGAPEVYAKLNDSQRPAAGAPLPELGSIKSAESAPVGDILGGDVPVPPEQPGAKKDAATADLQAPSVNAQSDLPSVTNSSQRGKSNVTLGSLAPSTESKEASREPAPPAAQSKTEMARLGEQPQTAEKLRAAAKESPAPAPTQKPAKVEAPTAPLARGWFAQVAAPNKRSEADDIARMLRRSGFPVAIENANVNGVDYFRVLVGPEDTKAQADRLVSQLKRERSVKGEPFLRMVK